MTICRHAIHMFAAPPASVTTPLPQEAPPLQRGLWIDPSTPPTSTGSPVAAVPARLPTSTLASASPNTAAPQPDRVASTLTVDDACKALKTSPGATWESIGQPRRLWVQQSSPTQTATQSAEKRSQALAEASRANGAYAALSLARISARWKSSKKAAHGQAGYLAWNAARVAGAV